jgi:hypothetical protein
MKKLILILALAAFVLSVALPGIEAATPSQAKITAPHSKSASHNKAKHHPKKSSKKHVSKSKAHPHK